MDGGEERSGGGNRERRGSEFTGSGRSWSDFSRSFLLRGESRRQSSVLVSLLSLARQFRVLHF